MGEKIILYHKKEDCCGCGACLNRCQENAIAMKEDEYGFVYPEIEEARCINCGACKKACSFQNSIVTNSPLKTYAAATKNTDIRQSASGGVFASLATAILEREGCVFGVALERMGGKLRPVHREVDSIRELPKLLGSKYVQSNTGLVYRKVKRELENGRIVFFSGTPCQVAGLQNYLHKEYSNLLTADIICHGVPSTHLFQAYLNFLGKKLHGKIIDFTFRDKTNGWGKTGKVVYQTKSGKRRDKIILSNTSSYYMLFLKSEIQRDSCYHCKYACSNRPGDITMGDYWEIQKVHPELLDSNGGKLSESKGISCLIVNTIKGEDYISQFGAGIDAYESSYHKAAKNNDQLNKSNCMSNERIEILDTFRKNGYIGVEKWFRRKNGIKRFLIPVYNTFPKGVKVKLNKVLGRA